jgi:phosphoglycolate phosphatase
MDYAAHIPQRFDLYIFDLDGTLIDSLDDLTSAMNATLGRYRHEPVDRETVRRAIGNGAKFLLYRIFSAASKRAPEEVASLVEEAMPGYRAEYKKRCVDQTTLYPGMREWLETLKRQGARLAVLTNKPEDQAHCILNALGVAGLFTCIFGPESAGVLKPDPAGVARIREKAGAAAERTIMIGDSDVDIHTARNAGIPCCGITGGIGDDEVLRALKPDYLIERMDDMRGQRGGN